MTPMAVRYHLNVLQVDNLVTSPAVRRQSGPGRPQQVFQLTEAADELFPEDYYSLTDHLLGELNVKLGKEGMIELFNSIAQRLASEAPPPKQDQTFEERLDEVMIFLRGKGFVVDWETKGDVYMIHAHSCPYRQVVKEHQEVCLLDKEIINAMLKTAPTRVACLTTNDDYCTYRVSKPIELMTE